MAHGPKITDISNTLESVESCQVKTKQKKTRQEGGGRRERGRDARISSAHVQS